MSGGNDECPHFHFRSLKISTAAASPLWRTAPMKNICLAACLLACTLRVAASDHLDTAAVIADPASDIGDLYAWMSPDAKRLNLVMTIVGRKFSDHVRYAFHVDSGNAPGKTTASISLECDFNNVVAPECTLS